MIGLTRAFEQLLAVMDALEIPYFVGGSVASGSYGLPRQTNDIDIIADFRQGVSILGRRLRDDRPRT